MNRRILGVGIFALLMTLGVSKAQTGVQAGAQAGSNANTSAQADKSGVKASNGSSANASAQAANNSADIASGTTMNATLSHPVDARKNKAGDEVTAKTTESVRSDGKVIIPKGSTLKGHVTQATAREGANSQSALGITFDRVVMSGGREMPVDFSIRAISAAESMASTSSSFGDSALSTGGSMGGGATGGGHASGGGLLGGRHEVDRQADHRRRCRGEQQRWRRHVHGFSDRVHATDADRTGVPDVEKLRRRRR